MYLMNVSVGGFLRCFWFATVIFPLPGWNRKKPPKFTDLRERWRLKGFPSRFHPLQGWGLSPLGSLQPVPGQRHKMVLCSQFEYPICNCVHNYSTFAMSDVILKRELNSDNKAMDCPGTNQNGVHTGTRVPDFCTRVLTPCPNSCLGACKRGVFTLVPSEYSNRAPSGNAALDWRKTTIVIALRSWRYWR